MFIPVFLNLYFAGDTLNDYNTSGDRNGAVRAIEVFIDSARLWLVGKT